MNEGEALPHGCPLPGELLVPRKASAPVLERHNGRYPLRCAFAKKAALSDKKADERLIWAMHSGLNTDPVCVTMDSHGTVAERVNGLSR